MNVQAADAGLAARPRPQLPERADLPTRCFPPSFTNTSGITRPRSRWKPVAARTFDYGGVLQAADHSAGSVVKHVRQIDVDERDVAELVELGAFDDGRGFEVLRDERGRISEVMFLEEAVN